MPGMSDVMNKIGDRRPGNRILFGDDIIEMPWFLKEV